MAVWTYVQLTGQIVDPDGNHYRYGYAGNGEGKNNPDMQCVAKVGPLPVGWYTMEPPEDTEDHGPYVLWLVPDASNDMCGRAGFGLHGDSLEHPGCASEGCIILSPKSEREGIWDSGVRKLHVIRS